MLDRALRKYREGGIEGLRNAFFRRVYSATPKLHPVQIALDEITKRDGFVIVQLGAYVGKTENDPLFQALHTTMRTRRGTLVVVEPIKEYFDGLVENYCGVPGVRFENLAISDRTGPAKLYRLGVNPADYGFPEWLSQLGSLREDRMGSLWDRYEGDQAYKNFYLQHRIEEIVNCITFSELLSRQGISKVDLLQIDVEGFEFEILSTLDFASVPIRFINYECVLLHGRKHSTEQIMRRAGYRLVDFEQDTFCYRDEDRRLARAWQRPWRERIGALR